MKSRAIYCVIMAGGRGTRFWPLSRASRPKQLLKMIGDRSMIQMTVDRLRKIKFVKGIMIIAGPDLVARIKDEIEGIPGENIIIEPSGKNTAPCIGLAAYHLSTQDPDTIMGVFPADHIIVGHKAFSGALSTARDLAASQNALVTIGVVPSSPHTGYGYIQFDRKNELLEGKAYKVKTFAEKPTQSAAKRFLRSGDFLWNSGMFVWKASTYLEAMQSLMPEQYEILREVGESVGSKNYQSTLDARWEFLAPQSVDYGILEKAKNIYVVRSEFEWSDVGSWNSFYEMLPKNGDGNVIRGDALVLDAKNNLIHSNSKMTAIVGMENIVVVNTDDATLILPRDRVEEVKKIVNLLQKSGSDDLL